MQFNIKRKIISFATILIIIISGPVSAQDKIIDLKFEQPPVSDSDITRTLKSLVEVRGISETYSTGGLYLITHFGDREDIFQKENQKAIDTPWRNDTWRYCSIFSFTAENSVIMGRNWDNQNVGSIIVSLYHPPKGFASISFSRAIELGFPLNVGLEQMRSTEFGNRLLLTPFYAMDGINERGLSVAVAGVKETSVKPKKGKESVFISFLIRKILDQTKNIKEAVKLVEKYVPFDLDQNSLNTHIFIVDSAGKSVILEYTEDQWKKIYGDRSWQALTNKVMYNVPEKSLREKCWRYRSISNTLEKARGNVDWKAGMKILQDVTQKGTTWSVIYSPATKELFLSVYQNWDKIYHLKPF